MKRFLYSADVTETSGTQTFYVDAETQEEADALIKSGEGDLYSNEVEVMDLGTFEPSGVTTTDDFGDFPPTQA